jgi:hypothetical protein
MKDIRIKEIFSKLKRGPTEYRTVSSKAHHDWKFMIIFFFLAWILIMAGSMYIFIEISRGEIFTVSALSNDKKNTLDKKVLESTVDYYESKKVKLNELKTVRSTTPDPSI